MGISEEQFKKMCAGTIHEGKYGPPTRTPKHKHKITLPEPEVRERGRTTERALREAAATTNKGTSETEILAGRINHFAPWLIGLSLAFEPAVWLIIAILLLVSICILEYVLYITVLVLIVGLIGGTIYFIIDVCSRQ